MLPDVYPALPTFRKVFTRHSTWLTFCVVVLGFLGSTQIDGVSSLCRFWHLETPGYLALRHLFRSSAWSLTGLLSCWWALVLSQQQTVMVEGQAVLIGDHTMTAKDGRRMPGVVTLHQDSETQSKPNYFRGHFWGAIGLLIGTVAEPCCLPLSLRIHQGFSHLRQPDTTDKNPETSATRLGQIALDFAVDQGQRCLLVLEAFFSVAAVFQLADSVWSVACKAPLVTMLVRAKKSYVASFPAERPDHPGPGRPRQYGDKVKLYEVFDYMHLFEHTPCQVYGALEDVAAIPGRHRTPVNTPISQLDFRKPPCDNPPLTETISRFDVVILGVDMGFMAPKERKHLSADALFGFVRSLFANVPDDRSDDTAMPLTDVLMAGFAMFSLTCPSLLDFDKQRAEGNLKTIYRIARAPCDSYMRERLDPVAPESLRPLFKE